ncbi:response regulator transcription factor [Janthinobacterium psychrotolerans]|uniref:RNA polymerase sigma factor, sigma-70 family n=1 Tax=Janthinobacterium psychrotolerans TaxID=1747903 RepID=A0A1A7BY30_9BURK|nr:response regulator [Janthinobacterium psychrotolerans]OBV37654.1 RNA polymerase sigma factor, sigma-70 family [Janthinobacterium psychrotolerans]
MSSSLTVFIVDDDPAVRDALGLLLGVRGFRTALFSCAEDFLQGWQRAWAGCVLIDIRMSGMDGLSLQRRLLELGCLLPVIIVTGHGDVALARQAFKAQASDFLEKPFDHDKLMVAIEEAFSREAATRGQLRRRQEGLDALATLTPREREVMQLVVTGRHNRDIAPALGISVRTVEVHKARLMDKLAVDNVADLVRISMLGSG